jgi:hypothetical protein
MDYLDHDEWVEEAYDDDEPPEDDEDEEEPERMSDEEATDHYWEARLQEWKDGDRAVGGKFRGQA